MDVCQTCGTQLLGRVDGDPVCRHCGPPGLGPIATTLDGRYWSAQDTPAVPARAGRPSPPASQQAQSPQHLNIPGAPLHARNSNPSSGSEGGEDNGDASDLAGLELSPDIFEQQLWDEAKQDEQAVAREGLFGDVAELLRKEQLQDLFDGLNLDDAVPDSGPPEQEGQDARPWQGAPLESREDVLRELRLPERGAEGGSAPLEEDVDRLLRELKPPDRVVAGGPAQSWQTIADGRITAFVEALMNRVSPEEGRRLPPQQVVMGGQGRTQLPEDVEQQLREFIQARDENRLDEYQPPALAAGEGACPDLSPFLIDALLRDSEVVESIPKIVRPLVASALAATLQRIVDQPTITNFADYFLFPWLVLQRKASATMKRAKREGKTVGMAEGKTAAMLARRALLWIRGAREELLKEAATLYEKNEQSRLRHAAKMALAQERGVDPALEAEKQRERLRQRTVRLYLEGKTGQAMSALSIGVDAGVSRLTQEALEVIRKKLPDPSRPLPHILTRDEAMLAAPLGPFVLVQAGVMEALRSRNPNAGPGPTGFTFRHLLELTESNKSPLKEHLTQLCNVLIDGRAPIIILSLFKAARGGVGRTLDATGAPTKLRVFGCADVVLRIATLALHQRAIDVYKPAERIFGKVQLGAGQACGAEAYMAMVANYVKRQGAAGQEGMDAVVFLDIVNQYYSVDMGAVGEAVARHMPQLLHHLPLLLDQSVVSFFKGQVTRAVEGLPVGDVFASLLANLATLGPLREVQGRLDRAHGGSNLVMAYADNIAVSTKAALAESVYGILNECLRGAGMRVERRPSNVILARVEPHQRQDLDDLEVLRRDQWTVRAVGTTGSGSIADWPVDQSGALVLGVPIGSRAFEERSMAAKANVVVGLVNKLQSVPFQVALSLVKKCIAPIMCYLARNVASSITQGPLTRIQFAIFELIERTTGCQLTDLARLQLTTTGNGFSFWDALTYSEAAFIAAQAKCSEITGQPPRFSNDTILEYNRQVPEAKRLPVDPEITTAWVIENGLTQKGLSQPIRDQKREAIKTMAYRNPDLAWKYEANHNTGAASWLEPAPLFHNPTERRHGTGKLALTDKEFIFLFKSQLLIPNGPGLPTAPGFNPTCGLVARSTGAICNAPMDPGLHHAMDSCLFTRYPKHQEVLYEFLNVVRELGNTASATGRMLQEDARRGDATISYYDTTLKAQVTAIIDVANIAVATGQERERIPASGKTIANRVKAEENAKEAHYKPLCEELGMQFFPVVTTVHGGFGKQGNQLFSKLADGAVPFSSLRRNQIVYNIRQRLQINIVKRAAQRGLRAQDDYMSDYRSFVRLQQAGGMRARQQVQHRFVPDWEGNLLPLPDDDDDVANDEITPLVVVPPGFSGNVALSNISSNTRSTSRPKQQKKSYKCGMCGVKGHNRTTCPQKQAN